MQFGLSATAWTQITQAGDTDDVQVRALFGSFRLSLGEASDNNAVTVVMAPVPPKSPLQTVPVVPAGTLAFARAIREPAVVQTGPAPK